MPAVDAGAILVIPLHVPTALLNGAKLEGVTTYAARHGASRQDAEAVLAVFSDSCGNDIRHRLRHVKCCVLLGGNGGKRHHGTASEHNLAGSDCKRLQKRTEAR